MWWLLPALALAGPPFRPGPHPMHAERMLERAVDLGFEEDLVEDLRALLEESRGTIEMSEAKLRGLHDRLRSALDADKPDAALVMQLSSEIGEAEQQLRDRWLMFELDVRAKLTPDQWKAIAPPPPPPPRHPPEHP